MDENEPLEMYLREVADVQPLTQDEEARLLDIIASKGTRDREGERAAREVIESRLPLVAEIANRYSATGVPMLDLIQEGNLGLMQAVDTFAASQVRDFSVYVATRIEEAIRRVVASRPDSP